MFLDVSRRNEALAALDLRKDPTLVFLYQ